MEKCYEYFVCTLKQCPAYDPSGALKCWQTQGTLCHERSQAVMLKYNKNKCNYCLYYNQLPDHVKEME